MMQDTQLKRNPFDFIWLPVLCIAVAIGCYFMAECIWHKQEPGFKLFGFSFSRKTVFNQPLFIHSIIGLSGILFFFLVGLLKSVILSNGNKLLATLLVVCTICFTVGINIPLINSTKFFIFKEQVSILKTIENLKSEPLLYWVIIVFTLAFPVVKLAIVAWEIFVSMATSKKKWLLAALGKWAMLDVLVVAVVVSTMKSGNGIMEIKTGSGLAFFVSSVLLSLIITTLLPYTKNKQL